MESHGTLDYFGRTIPWKRDGDELHADGTVYGWVEDTKRGNGSIGFKRDSEVQDDKRYRLELNLSLFSRPIHIHYIWGKDVDECARRAHNFIVHDQNVKRAMVRERLDLETPVWMAIAKWGKDISQTLEQRGEPTVCRRSGFGSD